MNARAREEEARRRAEQERVTELVEQARLGSASAHSALWARCNVVAKQVARRWTANAADVEDLSQEALLRAYQSFEALRNPAALAGWMQVIVVRAVMRRVRSGRRKSALMTGGADPEMLASPDASPDFQVDLRRVFATLGTLPEEERQCFWLRRAEGLRIEEIAQETSLSPSTVHRRVNVAERRLVKRLRDPRPATLGLP